VHVVNTLAPVFLVILLGLALRRWRFLSAEFMAGLGRLCYWVALPCLLFHKTATASLNGEAVGRTLGAFLIATAACLVVGYLVAWAMRMPAASVGTFVQACFRGNLAFVGLPVIIYALAPYPPEEAARLETLAILLLVPMVPAYNVAAVLVLLASRHRLGPGALRRMVVPIVTNPLVIACVAGGLVCAAGVSFPPAIDRALGAVSDMALPLALLGIGGSLASARLRGRWPHLVAAPLVKLAFAPAVGFLLAGWMGLGRGETGVLLVDLACPTAAVSFVLAQQLGGDEDLAASAVALSTVLAAVALSVAVAAF